MRDAIQRLLPDQLLERRCRDIDAGVSRTESEVFELFSHVITMAELERSRLWKRLDAEIARRGGCSAILGPD